MSWIIGQVWKRYMRTFKVKFDNKSTSKTQKFKSFIWYLLGVKAWSKSSLKARNELFLWYLDELVEDCDRFLKVSKEAFYGKDFDWNQFLFKNTI